MIWNTVSEILGTTGTLTTLYDHFSNSGEEFLQQMRGKSKVAFNLYCEYRKSRQNDIGEPLESKVENYWNSCLQRDVLPSASDLVSQKIASPKEAEILLPYLLESWMGVPGFVEWLHSLLILSKLKDMSDSLRSLAQIGTNIAYLVDNLPAIGELLTPSILNDAKKSCTELDIEHYYRVDSNFNTMVRVISAEQDIPHLEAVNTSERLIEGNSPVILTGSGGSGKTSLMLRLALQWVTKGRVAIWLALSNRDIMTVPQAKVFFDTILKSARQNQRILLCIDNPYASKDTLKNLQKAWPENFNKIQLIMAERENRLTLLTDPDEDYLFRWFDNANLVALCGNNQINYHYQLKKYKYFTFGETYQRRKSILDRCTGILIENGQISKNIGLTSVESVLKNTSSSNISLAELIYRTLFELTGDVSKFDVRLDWNEWKNFLKEKMSIEDTLRPYGVIAAYKIFHSPLPISLFCKCFNLQEDSFCALLDELMLSGQIEPIIYEKSNFTIQPKHEVIAELFFLFNRKKISINRLMLFLIKAMDACEIELLLANMINKKDVQNRHKKFGYIAYRDYMDAIYCKIIKENCLLSEHAKVCLCLGFLWARKKKVVQERWEQLNSILNELAPSIKDNLQIAKLYTEWGILAHSIGDDLVAEKKFRLVVDTCPNQIPVRTELGRLLATQRGREKEAENYFREAIAINPQHLHSRTELGRLLAKQKGREHEAEQCLLEAITINPKHLHSRIELGKLLSTQENRRNEAKKYFLEVLKISPNNIHAHTEMGRLLAAQEGCEKEAEVYFRSAIRINPKHLHSRTELGMLLAKQVGREKEAEGLFREAFEIEPTHCHSRIELGKLLATQTGREKEAEIIFLEVLNIDSKNFYGHFELGAFLETLDGRISEAKYHLNEAKIINPMLFNCLRPET